MGRILAPALVAPALLSGLAGCGTMANNRGEDVKGSQVARATRVPYGGVRWDTAMVAALAYDYFGEEDPAPILPPLVCRVVFGPLYLGRAAYLTLIDLPLSAVGDTVSLPYVWAKGPVGGALPTVPRTSAESPSQPAAAVVRIPPPDPDVARPTDGSPGERD